MASIARRIAVAVALATLALVAGPAAAQADPYVVEQCRGYDTDAPAGPFLSSLKATTGPASTPMAIEQTCDLGGPDGTMRAKLPGAASLLIGTSAVINLAIPSDRPHLTIQHVRSAYYMPPTGNPASNPAFQTLRANGEILVNRAAGTARDENLNLPAGTRSLQWDLYCGGGAGQCTFPDQYVIYVVKNQLLLNESVAPSLVVTGGSLVDGSDQHAAATLVFEGGDEDSGLASVEVKLGDTTVGGVTYACTAPDWSPCERSRPNQTLTVDTTQVADGAYPLTVVATDAAKNVHSVDQGSVVVANGAAQISGEGGSGLAPGPNGNGASRDAKLTVNFAGTRSHTKRIGFTSSPTIRGKVADEHGTAIGGATVLVSARLRRAGAVRRRVSSVTTGDDGRFTYKLPSGASRTLTFDYYAYGEDPKPSATRVLSALVRASLTGTPSPRRPRAGQVFRFSGRLLHLPRAGVRVDIQAYELGQWRPAAANLRTTADGHFHWSHRFQSAAAGHRFRFRAKVDSPIYPFAAGTSKAISVVVR